MSNKASESDERPDAEAEFQRVLGNLAAMPPKPHAKPSPPVPGRKRGRPANKGS